MTAALASGGEITQEHGKFLTSPTFLRERLAQVSDPFYFILKREDSSVGVSLNSF